METSIAKERSFKSCKLGFQIFKIRKIPDAHSWACRTRQIAPAYNPAFSLSFTLLIPQPSLQPHCSYCKTPQQHVNPHILPEITGPRRVEKEKGIWRQNDARGACMMGKIHAWSLHCPDQSTISRSLSNGNKFQDLLRSPRTQTRKKTERRCHSESRRRFL